MKTICVLIQFLRFQFLLCAALLASTAFADDTPLVNNYNVGLGPMKDVTIEGSNAFAIGSRTLHVLDLTNPSKPVPVGELGSLGAVRQIIVEDGLAYIASREDGVFIVDVSTSNNPTLVSRYDSIEFATGICKSGNVLFVACRSFGVELIDVADPAAPRHLSTVRTGEAQSVVERDGYLYAGVWASSEIVTVDVHNPWKPEITSRVPLDGFGDGVDVQGDYLYAATGHHSRLQPRAKPGDPGFGKGHGLEVLSIVDPANPKPISRIKFPPGYDIHNDSWSVTIAGHYAFVSDTFNGIFILNVQDPTKMQIAGHWTPPKAAKDNATVIAAGLVPGKDHVYVAGGNSDLHVLAAPGVSQISIKEEKSAVTIPELRPLDQDVSYRTYQTNGQVYAVDFVEDTAIIASGDQGVSVLKITPKFKELSSLKTKDKATDVYVDKKRIYIAEGTAGLGIYERISMGSLKEIGRYVVPYKSIRQVEVPGDGKYALLQIGVHKIQIVDVSEPAKLQMVLEDQHPGLLYGDQTMRGLSDDRYTCVFWHVSGLHWYDLKAKGGPRYTGDNFPGRIGSGNGLVSHQEKTLAVTRGGYLLLDRSERRDLNQVPLHRIGTKRQHLGKPTIAGNRLYTVNRQSGIVTVVDISNPIDPMLIDQFELPGNPSRAIIHQGILVIPDGYHGLLVFDQ
ncbi:MAG: hypothetical protein ACKVH8_17965 [Pirellulales bacterium]